MASAAAAMDPQKELPAPGIYLATQGGESACLAVTSDSTNRLFTVTVTGSGGVDLVCRPSVKGDGGNATETGGCRCIDQLQPGDSTDTSGLGYAGKFTATSITFDRIVHYTYATGVTTSVQDQRFSRKIKFKLDKSGACPP